MDTTQKLPLPDEHRELTVLTGLDAEKYVSYITSPDENGFQTIVEYGINNSKQLVKLTRKIRITKTITRVNKRVAERRRTWSKFGDCAGLPDGPEENITYESLEWINLNLKQKSKLAKQLQNNLTNNADLENNNLNADLNMHPGLSNDKKSLVKCRNCGEFGHFSVKCPKKMTLPANKFTADLEPDINELNIVPQIGQTQQNKYVPMHLRGRPDREQNKQPEEILSVHITNLSPDVDEYAFQNMVRFYGHTSRISIPRNDYGEIRGFAYVNYSSKEDAKAAIKGLNGRGFEHLILSVDWAKPRINPVLNGGKK
jgi:translation initiation factor 3 subunit G